MTRKASPKTIITPLHPDPARSRTLPGKYYGDPDVFEAEKERIFYRQWQLVAHVSELPRAGDFACAHVADQHIFVVRGKDDLIRGFYNVCQHRAHELLQGSGNLKSLIICPYHAWTYTLSGALHRARHTQHLPEFDPSDFQLSAIQTEVVMGFVFVNLDSAAPSLESIAGDMFKDIQAQLPWWEEVAVAPADSGQGWSRSELQANWKILAENCLECYHCAPAHPAFVDLIDMNSYVCEAHGAWLKSFGKLKNTNNKAYAIDPAEPVQVATYWHLWPNIEFGVIPGEAALIAFHFYPLSPNITRATSVMLNRPGESVRPERLDYRLNVLWPEDEAICQSVHSGLRSRGYHQGRFVIDPENPGVSEHAVHYFQRRYAEAMDIS